MPRDEHNQSDNKKAKVEHLLRFSAANVTQDPLSTKFILASVETETAYSDQQRLQFIKTRRYLLDGCRSVIPWICVMEFRSNILLLNWDWILIHKH